MQQPLKSLVHIMKMVSKKKGKSKQFAFNAHFKELYKKYREQKKDKLPILYSMKQLLDKYLLIVEFFGCNQNRVENLRIALEKMKMHDTEQRRINSQLMHIQNLVDDLNPEITGKIALLACYECDRLDEALNNLSIGSYHSAIIMSVVAVEARLHRIVYKNNKTIYRKYFQDKPLGNLINLFSDTGYKGPEFTRLKALLPREHLPLVQILNQYRILSAHPNERELTRTHCLSILLMSCSVLVDKNLKIDPKFLIC